LFVDLDANVKFSLPRKNNYCREEIMIAFILITVTSY
jgi:hypothetical protein